MIDRGSPNREKENNSFSAEVALATDPCGGHANIGMRMLPVDGTCAGYPKCIGVVEPLSLVSPVQRATPTTHCSIYSSFIAKSDWWCFPLKVMQRKLVLVSIDLCPRCSMHESPRPAGSPRPATMVFSSVITTIIKEFEAMIDTAALKLGNNYIWKQVRSSVWTKENGSKKGEEV